MPPADHGPDPGRFIVRLLDQHGDPVGAGFLVGPGQILTCAHVVNTALGLPARAPEQPDVPVRVDFPLLTGAGLPSAGHPGLPATDPAAGESLLAQVVRWVPPPDTRRPGVRGLLTRRSGRG